MAPMGFKRKLRYQRPRRTLGRYIKMRRVDQVLISMTLNQKTNADFRAKEKVHRYACTRKRYRRHKLGALYTSLRSHWMYHDEGGWTEDIDPTNVAETSRYRRKMEKSEDINATIDKWGTLIDDRVANQSMAPLECTFDMETPTYLEAPFNAEIVAAYADSAPVKRPLRHICWLGPGHLAGAYASGEFEKRWIYPSMAYVWDIENSIRPLVTLTPDAAVTCIECHDKQSDHLVSGLVSGGLAVWDLRLGPLPVAVTDEAGGHREVVTSVQWTLDSAGYEVFSGGAEGSIRWWDTRYLMEPLETITTDVLNGNTQYKKAPGVSALEINAEEPSKYLVGTQTGHLLYGDRETRRLEMDWRCPAFMGPVNSLERSEECPDIVLAAGAFRLHLFSDELQYIPVMTLKSEARLLTRATWCPTNPAAIHASRVDGTVETWNLLIDHIRPVHTLKVCDNPLLCARSRQEGDLLALGSSTGDLHLVRYTDSVYLCDGEDEANVQDLFSRELSLKKHVAEHKALTCFPDFRFPAASDKASPISSVRLSDLSLPDRWRSRSPIKLVEPPDDTVQFGDPFSLEDTIPLEESQSHESFETAQRSSTPSFDSDEWETDSETSMDDSCDSLVSFEDEAERQRRADKGSSFEKKKEIRDEEKLNVLGESELLDFKPQRPKSAENLATLDSKRGTPPDTSSKKRDSPLKSPDLVIPKTEASSVRKSPPGVSKLTRDLIEESHMRLGSGENVPCSFSTSLRERRGRRKRDAKSLSAVEKKHKSKDFVKSILESAAQLKATWKEPTLSKEGMSKEFEAIEAEFQTEDMQAITKAFMKSAKAHREYMWTQFGVPLKHHKRRQKANATDDADGDSDEESSDCDAEEENEDEIDEGIMRELEAPKVESKEKVAKRKSAGRRTEKARPPSTKFEKNQEVPQKNLPSAAKKAVKKSLKKKRSAEKKKSPYFEEKREPVAEKKASPESKKDSLRRVTFEEAKPVERTEEEDPEGNVETQKKRSRSKKKSKGKKKMVGTKSPRTKGRPWKL